MTSPLQVAVSPQSVPCSQSATTPTFVVLQVSVFNVSGHTVDLSSLQITLDVDPGAPGSGGALLLAAGTQPAYQIDAKAVTHGWTLDTASSTQNQFTFTPATGTAKVAAQECVTFEFRDVAVDLVPGAAQVGVAAQGVVAPEPGVVVKTAPGFGITQFSADPPVLSVADEPTTVSWATSGASKVTLSWEPEQTQVQHGKRLINPGAEVEASGKVTVTPEVTTWLTLTASGTGVQTAPLAVAVPETDIFLTQSKQQVLPGEACTLTWTVYSGASAFLSWIEGDNVVVTLSDGTAVASGDEVAASDRATVTTDRPTLFVLTAGGKSGSCVVNVPQVSLGPLSADPATSTPGAAVTLSWSAVAATGFTLTPDVGDLPGTQTSVTVSPQNTTTYQLVAHGYVPEAGPLPTASVAVEVPIVTLSAFTATPIQVVPGASATLSWESTNATGFTIDQGVGDLPAGTSQCTVIPPASPITYTLTAHGGTENGAPEPTMFASVTITPPQASIAAAPSTIANPGDTVTLILSALYASEGCFDPAIPGVGTWTIDPTSSQAAMESYVVPAYVDTTFTFQATGPGGSFSASAPVTVANGPHITEFTADGPNMQSQCQITWHTENAAEVTLAAECGGVTFFGPSIVDPSSSKWLAACEGQVTTYTLTAAGGSSPDTVSASQSVNPTGPGG